MRLIVAVMFPVLCYAQTVSLPAPVYSLASATSVTPPASIDLSATPTITVCAWMFWPDPPGWAAGTNNDLLAMEFGATPFGFASVTGGFIWDPQNSQAGGGMQQVGSLGSIGYNQVSFARPSANVWHHYCFVLDNTQPAATAVVPYIDGAVAAYTKTNSSTNAANTNNWAKASLYFMSRLGTQLVGPGTLQTIAIYSSALSAAQIAFLATQNNPANHVPPLNPLPPSGGGSNIVLPPGNNIGDVLGATWQMMSQPGGMADAPGWYFQSSPAPAAQSLAINCGTGVTCGGSGTAESPLAIMTDWFRVAVPASSSAQCSPNSYALDNTYLYICPVNNTWLRFAGSTW